MNGSMSDGQAHALPGPGQRLRCTACGNLTRFDVVSRRRTSAYWHYSLAGALTVDAEEELEAAAEQIRCRWCQSEQVEIIEARAAGGAPEDAAATRRAQASLE
jgi:hypothetical protein